MPAVRIESIAAGGDGVGRLDGLAVFTPRTTPGELVEVALRQRGRMARGRLLQVIEPSPDRVPPRCRHYDGDRCGGCQLQHVHIEAQRAAKQRIVVDAFRRIAKREVDSPPITASPTGWEYRSRLTLSLRWRAGRWTMGLHAYDDVDHVFDLHECPITDPRIVGAWNAVRKASHFFPRAAELRGTVRLLGEDRALVLEGGDAWPHSRDFASATPELAVIRWRPARGASRVIVDRRSSGTPDESFDQVNQAVAADARRDVLSYALQSRPATAVDAYAGLGATSRALADAGVRVIAIEADDAAARFTSRFLPAPSRVIVARVEDVIGDVLPVDVVVLNPPRTGVDERVTEVIESHRPPRVVYMSCDPATLARDVGRLPAYRVTALRAYDMFPQTAHVEVVCELRLGVA